MNIATALKLKNQLAGDVAQLKVLLTQQNVRSTKQKFDYDKVSAVMLETARRFVTS